MKLSYTLSASAIAGALLLSGCVPSNDTAPSESAVATPAEQTSPEAPEESSKAEPVTTEAEKVANAVSAYYDYVTSEMSLELIEDVLAANNPEAGNSGMQSVIDKNPEVFASFDTSSADNISNSVNQVYARSMQTGRYSKTTAAVPVEAVTVNGDRATVDAGKILITVNGTTHPATFAPYFELSHINLVRNVDGAWVMIPEPPRQSIQ